VITVGATYSPVIPASSRDPFHSRTCGGPVDPGSRRWRGCPGWRARWWPLQR